MNANEHRMYDLGRQAHEAGYPLASCNLSQFDPLRCWWVAGHVDRDIEIQSKPKQEMAA